MKPSNLHTTDLEPTYHSPIEAAGNNRGTKSMVTYSPSLKSNNAKWLNVLPS
jgi:hypothetical protein